MDQTAVQDDGAEKKFLPFFLPKTFSPKLSHSLEEAQKRNETATNRIIGIAVETRPDCLDAKEIKLLREYGVTRIEIGYQTTIDEINIATGRGHANAESIAATKMLKDAGFKVVCHMMPGLPGSNPDLDRESFARVWEDPDFRPDEVKIYPAVVVGNSEMANMYARGEFQPYSDEILIPLMAELQSMIPRYVRLNRSYRDIPASEILAGSKRANLRQLTESSLQEKHLAIVDISHREVRDKKNDRTHAEVRVTEYEASEGREYFIELIDPSDDTLFGHCRLRIPSSYFAKIPHFLTSLEGAAIIRELHVFGDQMRIGETGGVSQHRGFGTELLTTTENIIREKYPDIHRIAIIAGIGVREYYRKFGYETGEDGYVFKNISL